MVKPIGQWLSGLASVMDDAGKIIEYLKTTYATMEAMKNLAEMAQDEEGTILGRKAYKSSCSPQKARVIISR